MKITNKNLIGISVETQSGQKLGRIQNFNIETESQSVLEYVVKPANIIRGLIKSDLIISRGQVVDINDEKMIVEDDLVKEKVGYKNELLLRKEITSGATMKEF